jgi:hypothetical protein
VKRHNEIVRILKTGEFTSTILVDGKELTAHVVRTEKYEISTFEGHVDTLSIRWINDCEYVAKKMNPHSQADKKSDHLKILSTTENSYTFEYSLLGDARKIKGTATKTN